LWAASGREDIQEKILEKTEEIHDPGNALINVKSDRLRKMIIERAAVIEPGNGFPLKLYLMELENLNPELQNLAMEKINFQEGIFVDKYRKGEALRRILEFNKDKPEQMKKLLERMPHRSDMAFNPDVFGLVYFNEHFQEKTKDMDFANKFSVALTSQRYLERQGGMIDDENVGKVVDLIITMRERFSHHVILDENTYYIPITHEEELFENDKMVRIARDSGVKEIADPNLKGAEAKGRFLDFVRGSKDKGKTTIHFNNHGGPNHQWLSRGQAGVETSDRMRRPDAISYIELGDALAERGNLGEVTILIDSCYSKDFTDRLYHYLHSKGVRVMPTVITETNRGEVGWVNSFERTIDSVHEKGTPLTGADMFKIDSQTFFRQDLSVTMPTTSEEEVEFSHPKVPTVIDIESLYDDGVAVPPRRPDKEPSEEEILPTALPPTVIEIAQSEEEMEELLGIS
jgi:hypothetical protein